LCSPCGAPLGPAVGRFAESVGQDRRRGKPGAGLTPTGPAPIVAAMRIIDMNWMQVEAYLKRDDRVALPVGSVEQYAYLSLGVDMILSERVAVEAAEPLGVPVYPAMPFGITPYFSAFPGTVSLRVSTAVELARDILDSLKRSGFRRVLMVNGHGGNAPIGALAQEWVAANPEMSVKF
jgi:creatinine amidohydrolase